MDADSVVTPPHVARPFRLLPFRGLTLAPNRIGDPASVRALTRRYRGVADRLHRWEQNGQVVHDQLPAVYLHEYVGDGITVRGLVGALDISRRATARDEMAVFPHEGIHPAQADELAQRMLEMEINPAPILLVHRGSQELRSLLGEVARREPLRSFTDRGDQQHRLWAVSEPDELDTVAQALAPARALIADGHHRYAAYLRMQRQVPGPATDSGLAMLVDQDDTPLYLGAIHRVLGRTRLTALQRAAESAGIAAERVDPDQALGRLSRDRLVATDGQEWLTLQIDVRTDRTAVEVLHEDLIPRLGPAPSSVGHHHTAEDALAAIEGRVRVAVLMPAPDFEQVLGVAAADRLLPEKATSFQPKPNVGVLIRALRDG
ncbi:DUF1015 family protein [Nocardioides sp. SR21]|uniref:DUF1015 family protein n=1 Tax=Nocardioides sp. SR21 TaxID=2919501 RepID=UPI001FAA867F|nr:DUF1015 family protein [Nocardioides sp. SR21]